MAVTRIKNNQITDASNGNTQLGVNAAVKLQNYSVTAGKIANNVQFSFLLGFSDKDKLSMTVTVNPFLMARSTV